MSEFRDLIARFSKVKILVVGDVMLDRYWWGSVSRISPEAPVPVVQLEKTSLAAGGAANVAANVASLGATPQLVGVIGADAEGKYLTNTLAEKTIASDKLLVLENHPTTVKTRIVAHNQHVVRVDNEKKDFLTAEQETKLWKIIEKAIDSTDLVVVSDYAKGILTREILLRLITSAVSSGKQILIDPKGKDYSKYTGATLLTPNQREAREASGIDEANLTDDLIAAGNSLISKLNLSGLLITQGENGMLLFQNEEKPVHFPTKARTVYDVTGAGDTVIAALSVALAAGASLLQAVELSNIAAGLVVEEVGTTAINQERLLNSLV